MVAKRPFILLLIVWCALVSLDARAQSDAAKISSYLESCQLKSKSSEFDECIERVILGIKSRKISVSEDAVSLVIDKYYERGRCHEKQDILSALVGEAEAARRVGRCMIDANANAKAVAPKYHDASKSTQSREYTVSDTAKEINAAERDIVDGLIGKYIGNKAIYINELVVSKDYANSFAQILEAYINHNASSFNSSSIDLIASAVLKCHHCDKSVFAGAMLSSPGFGNSVTEDNIESLTELREFKFALAITKIGLNWALDEGNKYGVLTLSSGSFNKKLRWPVSCNRDHAENFTTTQYGSYEISEILRERVTWRCSVNENARRRLQYLDESIAGYKLRSSDSAVPNSLTYNTTSDIRVLSTRSLPTSSPSNAESVPAAPSNANYFCEVTCGRDLMMPYPCERYSNTFLIASDSYSGAKDAARKAGYEFCGKVHGTCTLGHGTFGGALVDCKPR